MLFKRRDEDVHDEPIREARVVDPSEDITLVRESAIDAVAEPEIVRTVAVIGPSIVIKGEVTGDEDLRVEGRVEGTVSLPQSRLSVGDGGAIEADVNAKTLNVEGHIQGDVAAVETVVLKSGGNMQGNITAPRITLEDGCVFNGTISMACDKGAVVTDLKSPTASSSSPSITTPGEQHAG